MKGQGKGKAILISLVQMALDRSLLRERLIIGVRLTKGLEEICAFLCLRVEICPRRQTTD